jgi:hypothetical protein
VKKKNQKLEALEQELMNNMLTTGPDAETFDTQLTHLERLKSLKKKKMNISHDTMAIVIGNVICVLIVVMYEQKHILTTKAMSLTLKQNINK